VTSSDDEGGNAGGESDDGSVVEVDDDDEKSGLSLNEEQKSTRIKLRREIKLIRLNIL
jgi:hypothetical protein